MTLYSLYGTGAEAPEKKKSYGRIAKDRTLRSCIHNDDPWIYAHNCTTETLSTIPNEGIVINAPYGLLPIRNTEHYATDIRVTAQFVCSLFALCKGLLFISSQQNIITFGDTWRNAGIQSVSGLTGLFFSAAQSVDSLPLCCRSCIMELYADSAVHCCCGPICGLTAIALQVMHNAALCRLYCILSLQPIRMMRHIPLSARR